LDCGEGYERSEGVGEVLIVFREAAVATEPLAIWVDDDELPIARFLVALSIPTLLKRDIKGCGGPQRLRVKMVDVGNEGSSHFRTGIPGEPCDTGVRGHPPRSSIRWTGPPVT